MYVCCWSEDVYAVQCLVGVHVTSGDAAGNVGEQIGAKISLRKMTDEDQTLAARTHTSKDERCLVAAAL